MLKKIITLCIICILLAGAGLFYVWNQLDGYVNQSVKIDEPTLVTIESGTSFNSLLNRFEKDGWIEPSDFSRLLRRAHPELTQVKAGTFQVQPNLTLKQTLLDLVHGQQMQFSITFVEGSTFKEWRTMFDEAPHLIHTTKDMTEAEIAEALQIDREKLEGLFLAETYHYTVGMSDLDIMKRSHTQLNRVLEQYWGQRQDKLPLKNAYEALILASIIEKETAVPEERPLVSSVFVNRLNIGMRLQTDPTVIYGMGDKYKGNIRKRDLQTPTPYNTYTKYGLTPTPIAMVGEEAIAAAVDPDDSKYLYFVASGDGGHVFSKNLRDHNRAVQEYLRKLRARK
ncbi:endolytic transglycosylase MltG [Vibrio breoganii]|uniref:endolytic transglycosylase MltG n=1 Tax=Vibrio breoganii TaxID=553239 RepID=UPI000C8620A9|nr:endolytic transglycosylase MltG [Vibrio breoganii]PMH20659.1 ABC transporter substrate-binding protein [Vibrio breoganii]PMM18858.1 ABC transporter substrate-binding protein [Vibrio breoganii]PMP12033.1 ABC transporter substrate-binding protein [Vibrio breoganii]TKG23552.1 endolytic transglycosylase MltG [Vibrio breoganii]